ncbi:MAG TPA: TIGR03618 family F420-dependent PPOX class oxidoreductase [Candidatus Dormibacteraeota bacterium]|nr:TIGR03618 family F420-dependent PPOX class oxidoreductase [Candidatus Dormibacteraeota bacterium]
MTDPALTIERLLSDELRAWLTAELRYPVLAVLTDEGAPSQSVMWFDLDPERPDAILMNTKVGRAKERYLRRDPRVSLCFEEGLTWVALRGTVELDDDRERALADIQALAVRYGDDPHKFDGQQRVTVRLRVNKVVRHDE